MQRSADALPSPVQTILGGNPSDEGAKTTEIAAAIEALAAQSFPRAALLDSAIISVGAERGFVLERDGEEWVVRAARTFEGEDVLNPLEKVILPILDRVEQRREAFACLDLTTEEIWPSLERQRTTRTCSLQVHPLPEASGYLYLDHRFQALSEPEEPASLAAIIGLLSWLSVRENHRVSVERLQDELRRARAEARGRPETPAANSLRGDRRLHRSSDHRRTPGNPRHPGAHRSRRAERRTRSRDGRERYGQGTRRAFDPRPQQSFGGGVHLRELRRDHRDLARERVVRMREGRLHRSG